MTALSLATITLTAAGIAIALRLLSTLRNDLADAGDGMRDFGGADQGDITFHSEGK